MMSQSHARTGMCTVAVAGTVGVLPWSQPAAVVVAAGLIVGGSVAPDLDHHASGPTKSFGLATRLLSGALQGVSALTYTLTRARLDPAGPRSHRTLSHSALGCLTLGALFGWLCSTPTAHGPIPAAVGVGLVTGLGVHALLGRPQWKRRDGSIRAPRKTKRRRSRARRWLTRDQWKWTASLLAAALVMGTPQVATGWWPWWLGAALTLGMVAHVAGDAMTDAGVPWTWPLLRQGRRWGRRHLLPRMLRFTTQHGGERVAVVLVTVATVVFCLAVLTGPWWWPFRPDGAPTRPDPVPATRPVATEQHATTMGVATW